MRLLHLSDLHIGKRVNEFPMIEDQRFALEGVLRTIHGRAVDALLVAGDLYDKSSPSAEAVALVDWFLSEAAGTGAAVFVIAGNHDSAERVAYGAPFFARHNVFVSPVYDGEVASVTLEDDHGPVTFWLLPFLKPATVRPWFPEEEIETYTDALRCVIEACPIDRTRRNVALSHQFATSGGAETERTDSELSLGGIDNVDASVYDPFDYVALGHVHKPQRVGREEVRYSGSLLKYSFSEIKGEKTMPLVELGPKGEVDIEFVPIVPLHDMRPLRGPLEKLLEPENVAAGDPEDYLSVTLTDELPALDALERLRRVFPNVMGLSYDNARSQTADRAGTLDTAELSDVSPLELFERFYEERNGLPMTERQREYAIRAFEKAQVI